VETEAIKARTKTMQENMGTSHKEIMAEIKPRRDMETMACQEMEARLEGEQPTSLDRKPEAAERREVPLEDTEVMPVEEPKKKRRRDQKLAAEHRHQKPKIQHEDTVDPRRNWCHPQRDNTPCESGMENANRHEDVPPCNSGTTQEKHLQGEQDSGKVSTAKGTGH
jgi:hypothetical protein